MMAEAAASNAISDESFNNGGDDDNSDDDCLAVHMDLSQPILHLQSLIENIIGLKLNDYSFWLQDSQIVSTTRLSCLSTLNRKWKRGS